MNYTHQAESNKISLFSKRTWWIIFVVGLVGLGSLFKNHTTHILSILPYLILLACPLMHIFMHGSHGGHNHK